MQLCHVNGVQSIGSHVFEFKLQCMFFPYDVWGTGNVGFIFPLSLDFVYKALNQRF